jgi:hypothetical protein
MTAAAGLRLGEQSNLQNLGGFRNHIGHTLAVKPMRNFFWTQYDCFLFNFAGFGSAAANRFGCCLQVRLLPVLPSVDWFDLAPRGSRGLD